MAALMVVLAIMMIVSTVATQAWIDVLQRDNEAEMMFRAQEIVRAMVKYRQDKGTNLLELEQLLEPGKRRQYFLRQLYEDPLVKDGKWGLLYAGPDGSIVDPNSSVAGEPLLLGDSGTIQSEGGLQGGFSGGPRQVAGLPIIGVKSLSKATPFRVYKGFSDYSMWPFTIYDLVPQARQTARESGKTGKPKTKK